MKEAFTLVIMNFKSYIGDNAIGYIMWACFCAGVVYLLVRGSYFEKVLSILSIVGFLIFFNPITYKIIGDRFVSGVYWRMFWVIPVVLVMAVAFTELASRIGNHAKNEHIQHVLGFVCVLVICAVVAKIGICTYDPATFVVAENAYQLPEYTVEVADIILTDAKSNTAIKDRQRHTGAQTIKDANGNVIEDTTITENIYPLALVPDEMVTTMRQYTSEIAIAYGRNIWGHMCAVSEPQKELQALISNPDVDFEELHEKALSFGCDYMVMQQEGYTHADRIESSGFVLVDSACGYGVYRVVEQ